MTDEKKWKKRMTRNKDIKNHNISRKKIYLFELTEGKQRETIHTNEMSWLCSM